MAEVKRHHYEVAGATPIDPKSKEKLKLEDSNLANYGSAEHKALKLKVAKTEAAWAGAGAAPGNQVWRVEKFKIHSWPTDKYGSFYDGDAYIVLHTYKAKDKDGKETPQLNWNVHFWLGKKSSQDERGVAAYKTVELDDLLGDAPVQYREVQGKESKEFTGLWPAIKVMGGGIDSGFNHAKPTEYKHKLLRIDGANRKAIRVDEVDLKRESLNQSEVFILDGGLDLWQWQGKNANMWEKRKAEELLQGLYDDRNGRATKKVLDWDDDDSKFWAVLGGKGPIAEGEPKTEKKAAETWHPSVTKSLFRVDIAPGASDATFTPIKTGGAAIAWSDLKQDQCYILDVQDEEKHHHVYVWVGSLTSKSHVQLAMQMGHEYITKNGLPEESSLARVIEGGQLDQWFVKAVSA